MFCCVMLCYVAKEIQIVWPSQHPFLFYSGVKHNFHFYSIHETVQIETKQFLSLSQKITAGALQETAKLHNDTDLLREITGKTMLQLKRATIRSAIYKDFNSHAISNLLVLQFMTMLLTFFV